MSKHTPGPWKINTAGSGDSKGNLVIDEIYVYAPDCGVDDVAIAGDIADPLTGQPSEVNARLIAASPDLYAVLKELQESAQYWSEYDVPLGIVDRINQAIAKAEGNA